MASRQWEMVSAKVQLLSGTHAHIFHLIEPERPSQTSRQPRQMTDAKPEKGINTLSGKGSIFRHGQVMKADSFPLKKRCINDIFKFIKSEAVNGSDRGHRHWQKSKARRRQWPDRNLKKHSSPEA
jgi:hypothetical protein